MAETKYKNKRETDEGTTVYEYSDKQVQHRNREKAKKVEQLSKKIDDLRKQVKKDLASDDSVTKLKALAVALMDQTYERIGNENSAEERGHHGVTVWRKKHVKFNGNKATIKYTGKSGVDHTKTVDDPKVVKVLKEFTKDKSGDDFVFDCGDEDDTCVRAKDVNDYLSKFDTTAKDIRGYHANRLMQETLKDLRKKGKKLPDDKKKREELLKEEFDKALEIVAGEVGHEAATLKSNYLVPALEDTYMDGGKVIDKLDKKKSAAMKTARNLTLARYVAQRYMRKSRTSTRNLNELLDANQVYMGPLDEGMVEAMDAAGVDESILSLMRDRINDRNGN